MTEATLVEIEMPAMGESVTEGTVLEWHVKEGEAVEEGQTIVEVSTDKVDAEVPAPASGVVAKILAQVDETVAVGQVLAQLDPNGTPSGNGGSAQTPDTAEAAEAPSDEPSPDPAAPGSGAEEAGGTLVIEMPEMGESVTEGTVLEWHVAAGDAVDEGQTVIEVSTDKVDAEVPAPAAGTITKLLVDPDDVVKVGQPLVEMAAGAAPAGDGAAPKAGADAAQPAPADAGGARATPVARRAAGKNGVELGGVQGSGPGGKVTKADVLAAADGHDGAGPAVTPGGEATALRGPAAMLANAMDKSREIPTATSFRTVPVDTLDAKRKALNGVLSERGMKISFTHLIAWAIVKAAEDWPVMGRSFEMRDGKPFAIDPAVVNLGIAVDVERKGGRSLMVPCIKGASGLDFAGFHAYYEDLITKTRENKLTADDLQGTTISLTNPGGLGTVASVPRLMSGQGTIVACGSLAYPVEWAHATPERIKALGVSKVMTMTSTYDHRVIQGAESGSFLRRIDQLLQGEDNFYEGVASDMGLSPDVVTSAYPASASAAPLGGAVSAPATPAMGTQAPPDYELLQAVQAATSLLKARAGMLGLARAGAPGDDGVDELEVRRVGVEAHLHLLLVGGGRHALGAVVVLHVTRARVGNRSDRLHGLERLRALELGQDRLD